MPPLSRLQSCILSFTKLEKNIDGTVEDDGGMVSCTTHANKLVELVLWIFMFEIVEFARREAACALVRYDFLLST